MTDILEELKKPFHPTRITWKPGAIKGDKTAALALAYADLRAYQDRLDDVCGLDWSVNYTPWGEKIICNLSINGITRSSTGEPTTESERGQIDGTVAEAQAFKRACAMFGLGRYLYELPSIWVDFDGKSNRFTEQGKSKLTGIITQHYQRYLDENKGAKAPQPAQPSNRTAQHRNVPQRPATQPTPPSVPVPQDVDYYETMPPTDPEMPQDEWEALASFADANEAADKKAKQPFVWPVSGEALGACAFIINNPNLSDNAFKMNKAVHDADRDSKGKMSNEVKEGKKSSHYGTLVWQLDQRYGKDSHSAILTALCGRLISHDNLPGFDVAKVLDWLFNKDDKFSAQLGVLDAYVESLKADIAQFEVA